MPIVKPKINIFWFRRDLRLHDNFALYNALKSELPVLPIFIFDTDILSKLENKNDARVEFIHNQLLHLKSELENLGSSLYTAQGKPADVFGKLVYDYDISEVFANEDYEPDALKRDGEIKILLAANGIKLHLCTDQVIWSPTEILKSDGLPYTVYTPYSRKWLEKLENEPPEIYKPEVKNLLNTAPYSFPTLNQLGFEPAGIPFPENKINTGIIENYENTRNYPAIAGTSLLGMHLRFGTVSVRQLAMAAKKFNPTYLKELAWREFFMMIMYHFPHSATENFKTAYNKIAWRNNEAEFKKWCLGQTGYPIVDAGMRELNSTGLMHNRVRMITASFLCKHLLIDWRWGEAYFAGKLLDYDLASNAGNWQWVAGTGVDAAPYFRIFNPSEQVKKFDPELKYIKKWVPELNSLSYPQPMVVHEMARKRALEAYGAVRNNPFS